MSEDMKSLALPLQAGNIEIPDHLETALHAYLVDSTILIKVIGQIDGILTSQKCDEASVVEFFRIIEQFLSDNFAAMYDCDSIVLKAQIKAFMFAIYEGLAKKAYLEKPENPEGEVEGIAQGAQDQAKEVQS
ncbi:hypothetical protein ACFL10_02100 [Patescibacteria group bacterium]